MMRIAYVGNFREHFCTESHLGLTLEALGHRVTRIQEDKIEPGTLPGLVAGHDLFLWTRTWPGSVTHLDLSMIRDLGPSVSYHLDLYVGLQRGDGLDTDAFWRTDYVFTPDGDPRSAKVFAEKGINHYYSPPGVYAPECVPGTFRPEFACDVVFVGGGAGYHEQDWPYRQQLLAWLADTYGPRFRKFGYPEPTVRNQDLNDVYASAKVAVGDSLCSGFTHESYSSDRLTETCGRSGSAALVYPRIKGIAEVMYDHVTEVVFYDYADWAGLREAIDGLLDHDGYRQRVCDAARLRTIREHTYHARMRRMLEVVGLA